ncbi:sulfurtransferase TusA family protein [Amorphus orientalis]|uniref:tRNA 2-thiouridine synthesizing protein A n=1 Tax=Amorphus orientalis TaxID=649198 RepID=A0AAE3VR90_9HYPH|nr:sulfurtransferase TusA family protein [Amorphus orientalis]MDQ0316518.1 tRNA 2-thiouridine synthesizing protein A [Amorphus orientalis]
MLSTRDEDDKMSAGSPNGEETHLDLKGLKCPMPVLRLAKAIRSADEGARFRVEATDPMAKLDVAHFCNTKGHRLLESAEGEDGVLSFLVEAGGPTAEATD